MASLTPQSTSHEMQPLPARRPTQAHIITMPSSTNSDDSSNPCPYTPCTSPTYSEDHNPPSTSTSISDKPRLKLRYFHLSGLATLLQIVAWFYTNTEIYNYTLTATARLHLALELALMINGAAHIIIFTLCILPRIWDFQESRQGRRELKTLFQILNTWFGMSFVGGMGVSVFAMAVSHFSDGLSERGFYDRDGLRRFLNGECPVGCHPIEIVVAGNGFSNGTGLYNGSAFGGYNFTGIRLVNGTRR
ncbi:MAG: hypothetical protein MMC33_004529 [Icmadophila ericetorum]|nr:hypothetical protein [Icmadophila ericetorum]